MHRRPRTVRPILLTGLVLSLLAPPARAAAPDGNVEWAGLSHVGTSDRRPLCPVSGESFQVRFQAWRNDLTSAWVHVVAGATITDVPATRIGVRGPYDVWAATVPATAASTESYWIGLTDGALTDYLSVTGPGHTVPVDGGWTLDFGTLAHAPMGATLVSGGAVFKVWAPAAVGCVVRGDFNGWTTANPLAKVGEYFIGRVAGANDLAEYKYFFNNATWNTDPYARWLDAANGPYNARIENPFRYAWGDTGYAFPAADSLVIYQLHVGTFCGLNDPYGAASLPSTYNQVAARVGHLKELGVNAVMLNPVTEFPGDWSAGYNPITAFSPEWKYGAPDDLKHLVDTLHRNGIAVILDIVWNHFSDADNFLWNYDGTQEWFSVPNVTTAWGSQAAFEKGAVSDYYANSARYWFEEFHVDGFRMDATSAMTAGSPPHSTAGWTLMGRLNNEKANRSADRITIAEQLPSDPAYSTPTSSGGAGFDAQYQMSFRDGVRNAIFAAAFGDPNMNDVRNGLVGSGPYLSGAKAVNYVQLHDEAWPSSGGQRLVKTIDSTAPNDDVWAQGRSKLAEGLTFLSQGIPAMLMGDEWLENIDFGPAPGGGGRIDWSKKVTYAPIFHFYQRLLALRRTVPALWASAPTYVSQVNEGGNVIAYRRLDGAGNPVMVIANFSNTDYPFYRFGVPVPGDWTELLNSQDPQYGGSGPVNGGTLATDPTAYDVFGQSLAINLPKMTLAVFAPASYLVGVAPTPRTADLELSAAWPNPARAGARVTYALAEHTTGSLAVVDVTGRVVRTLVSGPLPAGRHAIAWDGADARGRAAPPGLYFLRLATPQGTRSTRLAIVR
jgi:1,4-alpha-glucan branching enzyme